MKFQIHDFIIDILKFKHIYQTWKPYLKCRLHNLNFGLNSKQHPPEQLSPRKVSTKMISVKSLKMLHFLHGSRLKIEQYIKTDKDSCRRPYSAKLGNHILYTPGMISSTILGDLATVI